MIKDLISLVSDEIHNSTILNENSKNLCCNVVLNMIEQKWNQPNVLFECKMILFKHRCNNSNDSLIDQVQFLNWFNSTHIPTLVDETIKIKS